VKIASGRQLEASKNMGNLTSPDLVVWDISEYYRGILGTRAAVLARKVQVLRQWQCTALNE